MTALRLPTAFNTCGNAARKPLNEETGTVYNTVQCLTNKKHIGNARDDG
ncbi:MAG: hypothetical protein LBB74_03410 [Chitinispirillales bacterium]|nr:hypothetical protein [Chitinispirillales bacterium]